jgi:hypothetical protein
MKKGWHQRKHKRTSSKGKKFSAGVIISTVNYRTLPSYRKLLSMGFVETTTEIMARNKTVKFDVPQDNLWYKVMRTGYIVRSYIKTPESYTTSFIEKPIAKIGQVTTLASYNKAFEIIAEKHIGMKERAIRKVEIAKEIKAKRLRRKFKRGDEVYYSGGWGSGGWERTKITSIGVKNGQTVYSNDLDHWGYEYQYRKTYPK